MLFLSAVFDVADSAGRLSVASLPSISSSVAPSTSALVSPALAPPPVTVEYDKVDTYLEKLDGRIERSRNEQL